VVQEQSSTRRLGVVYASAPRQPDDDWIAVVAESFVALIDPEPGGDAARALARLAEEGETSLERVISAIPVGDGGVDSFAVVHFDSSGPEGWQVSAIARGRAVVDVYSVGGARRFSSSGVQPWLIATFRDVVAVDAGGPSRRFDAEPHLARDAAPVTIGMARAGSVLWSAGSLRGVETERQQAETAFVREPAVLDDDTIRHVRGPARSNGALLEHELTPPGFDEETVQRPSFRREPGAEHESALHESLSEHAGEDVAAPPRSPAIQPPSSPARSGRSEPDERTVVRAESSRFPLEARAVEREGIADGDAAPPTAGSDASDLIEGRTVGLGGEAGAETPDREGPDREGPDRVLVGIRGHDPVELDAPVVFGRRPAALRRSGVQPVLVTVASPGQEVSASHVRIEREGDIVIVTDLRSRNGTTVRTEGGRVRKLRPGESFPVLGAAEVGIGDGTVIDITPVWWVA
jgi:hypothetical protein